jgi:hypothetical protein
MGIWSVLVPLQLSGRFPGKVGVLTVCPNAAGTRRLAFSMGRSELRDAALAAHRECLPRLGHCPRQPAPSGFFPQHRLLPGQAFSRSSAHLDRRPLRLRTRMSRGSTCLLKRNSCAVCVDCPQQAEWPAGRRRAGEILSWPSMLNKFNDTKL